MEAIKCIYVLCFTVIIKINESLLNQLLIYWNSLFTQLVFEPERTEGVELYLYSPSGSSWPFLERTLPSLCHICLQFTVYFHQLWGLLWIIGFSIRMRILLSVDWLPLYIGLYFNVCSLPVHFMSFCGTYVTCTQWHTLYHLHTPS